MTIPKIPITGFLIAFSTLLSAWNWEEINTYVQVDGRQRRSVVALSSNATNVTNATLFNASNWTLFYDTNTTVSNDTKTKKIDIQLAITGSIKIYENAMRLLTTSVTGWHQDFEDIQIYTFDEVHENSPFYKILTPVKPLFEKEKTKKNNNLLLAAIEGIYNHNPNAEWYFLAEDDSIIIKENLLFAIKRHRLNSSKYVMAGKSVVYRSSDAKYNELPFVVGGSGVLLSHTLIKELAPHIPACREKYNRLAFGDARIGACIQFELNMTEEVQPMHIADLFTNGNPMTTIDKRGQDKHNMKNHKLISLHEKDPARIQLIQDWISNQRAKNKTITWKAMRQSGLHIGLNQTKST